MFSKFWFCFLLIISLGITSYSFMLGSSFKTSDDNFSIVKNPLIRDQDHLSEIFTSGYFKDNFYYRPLVNVSYMQEYQLFGLNAFFYNLDNMILHIFNALLVWALAAVILKNTNLGFWVGVLFVIHPIHAEAVNNISGRAILLSASFILMALIAFLKYQEYPKKILLFLSSLSFLCALLCKESAGVLPLVMMLVLWFMKKRIKDLWPFFLVIVFYLAWRTHLGITQTFPWHNLSEALLGFSTFLRSLLTDLRLLVVPIGLYFDRSQRLFTSIMDLEFLLTMTIWLGVAFGVWKNRFKVNRLMVFLVLWCSLELLPVSQLVTAIGVSAGRISSADHFLYMASIPIFIAFVVGAKDMHRLNQERQWVQPKIVKGLMAGFLVFFFMMNIEQNIYASHEMSMLKRSLEYEPLNARIQYAVGSLYVKNGQFQEAQEHFYKAMASSPENPRYRISFIQSICDQGHYQECLGMYNQIHVKDVGTFANILENNKKEVSRLIAQHNAQILPK